MLMLVIAACEPGGWVSARGGGSSCRHRGGWVGGCNVGNPISPRLSSYCTCPSLACCSYLLALSLFQTSAEDPSASGLKRCPYCDCSAFAQSKPQRSADYYARRSIRRLSLISPKVAQSPLPCDAMRCHPSIHPPIYLSILLYSTG